MLPSASAAHLDPLIRHGYARIRRGNQLLSSRWGHDAESTCHVDLERATATLRYPTRRDLTVPVQYLGTYTRSDAIFTWAWTEDLPEEVSRVSRIMRRYGTRRRLSLLSEPQRHCRQDEPWNITAIGTLLSQAWTGFELQDSPNEYRYLLLGRPEAPDTPKRIVLGFQMPTTMAA
ncbi:MAG: hypothetical protein LKF88_04395 [Microbacteriaceae bacterium]|nr:hypothetical protein [Microbacteriaceae bacterium]MCI1206841.1 hypothetical protein [Microbacteriaceae bacterium]